MRVARLGIESGCKVGWEIYDNEAEALEAAERAKVDAERKWAQGYDFGYQVPGAVKHVDFYYRHGDQKDQPSYEDCWVVTIP